MYVENLINFGPLDKQWLEIGQAYLYHLFQKKRLQEINKQNFYSKEEEDYNTFVKI